MPYEKKFTLVVAGSFVGAIISFILSGVLCEYGFDGGWPSVFYIFGKGSELLLGMAYHCCSVFEFKMKFQVLN